MEQRRILYSAITNPPGFIPHDVHAMVFRNLPHPQRDPLFRGTSSERDSVRGLGVRYTRTPALNLTASPSCGCSARYLGPKAQRGVPRSGVWSERKEYPPCGDLFDERNRSERAQGRERSGAEIPPRALRSPLHIPRWRKAARRAGPEIPQVSSSNIRTEYCDAGRRIYAREPRMVEEKGIEPSTPTLRTWCSPN